MKKKIKWHGFTNFDTRKKVFLHVVKMCLLESPIFNTKCSRFLPTFHRPFFVNCVPLFHPWGSAKGIQHWWTNQDNSSVQLNLTTVWAMISFFLYVLCVLVIERNYLNSYCLVIIIEYSFENRTVAHLKFHEQFSIISINISWIQYKSIKQIN